MVIITADDYGKTAHATDSILRCYSGRRITSASAMVFMEDSVRAASLASQTGLEVGLHLNFSMPFSTLGITQSLRGHQEKVIAWLTGNKFAQVVYNPFLAESFAVLFRAQKEEFTRLYGRNPDFYNGHHHMHLCANVLAGQLIPNGARVRTTFTFDQGERNPFNRLYRRYINGIVSRRYITTDRFYSIVPVRNRERLRMILSNASREDVEVEVHPENADEIEFLMSDEYGHFMGSVPMGNFQQLRTKRVINS
jgi:predicted glycoside hydrolase/deacetylase ChbG (UPF0249 family)